MEIYSIQSGITGKYSLSQYEAEFERLSSIPTIFADAGSYDSYEWYNDPSFWALAYSDFGSGSSASGMHSHAGSSARGVSAKGKELLKNKEFMDKVKSISDRIGCDFKDLLGVMRAESGLNPAAVNKHGGASGLIQFMPKTAQGLGTSAEAIRNMSAVQQLDYVEKFLIRAKRSAGFKDGERLSAGQLYALVFLPARAKREVLTESGEAAYKWNSATDTNGDGKITRSEMDARAKRFRVDEYIPHEFIA